MRTEAAIPFGHRLNIAFEITFVVWAFFSVSVSALMMSLAARNALNGFQPDDRLLYGVYLGGIVSACYSGVVIWLDYKRHPDTFYFFRTRRKMLVASIKESIQQFVLPETVLFRTISGDGVATQLLLERKKFKLILPEPPPPPSSLDGLRIRDNSTPGFIYIMRRQDGIYKIGRSDNTARRLQQHMIDYGMGFELIKRFAVPDAVEFEKLALQMTKEYHHDEPGRSELRKINSPDLDKFIGDFLRICVEAVSK